MWATIQKELGNPIGNPKVGELLKTKLIQAGTDLPTALEAMKSQPRTEALKQYIGSKP